MNKFKKIYESLNESLNENQDQDLMERFFEELMNKLEDEPFNIVDEKEQKESLKILKKLIDEQIRK